MGLVETLVFETVRARLDECVDEVLAICTEEIPQWQIEPPERGVALKHELDKRALSIASYIEAIADGYSKELGNRLRALQAERAIAVAELANIAADAPVLPSPDELRERIRTLCDLSRAMPVEDPRELLRGVPATSSARSSWTGCSGSAGP